MNRGLYGMNDEKTALVTILMINIVPIILIKMLNRYLEVENTRKQDEILINE